MRMPTKEQVEEYILAASIGLFVDPDSPIWSETITKHLREWAAEYENENKGKKDEHSC